MTGQSIAWFQFMFFFMWKFIQKINAVHDLNIPFYNYHVVIFKNNFDIFFKNVRIKQLS